jgi:competence protein ComEC
MAPWVDRADLLISSDARLVAVRSSDGHLSALGERGTAFILARWLEHEGDPRLARDVGKGEGFRCDSTGCTVRVEQLTLAIDRHPAALAEDCARADLLVLAFPRPVQCRRTTPTLDRTTLERGGTHVGTIKDGRLHFRTVAAVRGDRPWSRAAALTNREPDRRRQVRRRGSRAGEFASPYNLGERPLPAIPGAEEWADPIPGDDP